MIRTRTRLVEELIRLYDADKKLTWNSISKVNSVFSALSRRNTDGRKLFESIVDAREAVAQRLELEGRIADASALRKATVRRPASVQYKPLEQEELDRRRSEFIKELQYRHKHKLPISFEYYKQTDYSKLAKMRRAFGTYQRMLDQAGISEADVIKKIVLPIEAHICMMYDFYLQGNNPSLLNVLVNMPSAGAKMLNTFNRSYEPALSMIERLLTDEGLVDDAAGFNPANVRKRSLLESKHARQHALKLSQPRRLQVRQQKLEEAKSKMYLFEKNQTYDDRDLPAEFKYRLTGPITGLKILSAVRKSSNWIYSVDFAKMVGAAPNSVMSVATRIMPKKMIRVQLNHKVHYFLAKECVKEYMQVNANGSTEKPHVNGIERTNLLQERYLLRSGLYSQPKIKNL